MNAKAKTVREYLEDIKNFSEKIKESSKEKGNETIENSWDSILNIDVDKVFSFIGDLAAVITFVLIWSVILAVLTGTIFYYFDQLKETNFGKFIIKFRIHKFKDNYLSALFFFLMMIFLLWIFTPEVIKIFTNL